MADHTAIQEAAAAVESIRVAELEAQLAESHRQNELLELAATAVALRESWGDAVDPLEHLYDDPNYGSLGRPVSPVSQIGDRKHGQNFPIYQTETELAAIRGTARLIYDAFPTAQTAMANLVSYVLGDGLSYRTAPKHACPKGLDGAVQEVCVDFLTRNRWFLREEEFFVRTRRDGDAFLYVRPCGYGDADLMFLEPTQVTEPSDPRAIEDWLDFDRPSSWHFGIHTDPRNVEQVFGYYVQWTDNPGDFDYLTPEHVLHVKQNVDSGIKRGLPDFYCVQQHLTNIGKLEKNVAVGAAILSAIIGIRQHAQGTTQNQVQQFLANTAWRTGTQSTPNGTKSRYTQKLAAGSFLDIPKGLEYLQSPLANQGVGEAFVTIEQALFRTVGTRWCMPEFMISGDASNANYNSTSKALEPFFKYCSRQRVAAVNYTAELLWKVLAVAVKAGRFARYGVRTLDGLKSFVALKIRGPIVETGDRPAETNRRKILRDEGIVSPETWAAEEGYDLAEEQARGAQRSQVTLLGQATAGETVHSQPPTTIEATPEEIRRRLQEAARVVWEGYP